METPWENLVRRDQSRERERADAGRVASAPRSDCFLLVLALGVPGYGQRVIYVAENAVGASAGSAYVLNSAFFGNSADGSAGGMWVGDGGATIRNSIFWGNSGAQFSTYSTSFIDVDYGVVQGWTGSWGGIGNSGVDPMFVDPDGPDDVIGTEDDNLRLSPDSPAINAGDPNPRGLPSTDLNGHARVLCGRVDIGGYEFGIGDYDYDQTVDLSDFANWSACMTGPRALNPKTQTPNPCAAFDFNADQSIDLLDFAALQSAFPPPGR